MRFNVRSAVEEFCRNPAANSGFLLINTMMTQELDVFSSEAEDPTLRPKLTITYTVNGNSVPRKFAPFVQEKQLRIHTTENRFSFDGTGLSSTTFIRILKPDGSLVYACCIDPGNRKIFTTPGPGMYIVSSE